MKTKTLFILLAMLKISLFATIKTASKAIQLTVNFQHLEAGKGTLYVAVYHNEKDFENKEALVHKKIKVSEKNATLNFDLPEKGEYAIICFQDLNENHRLDFSNYMPDEPWGLSNNIEVMRPPTWDDAKFTVKNNRTIDIQLF